MLLDFKLIFRDEKEKKYFNKFYHALSGKYSGFISRFRPGRFIVKEYRLAKPWFYLKLRGGRSTILFHLPTCCFVVTFSAQVRRRQ